MKTQRSIGLKKGRGEAQPYLPDPWRSKHSLLRFCWGFWRFCSSSFNLVTPDLRANASVKTEINSRRLIENRIREIRGRPTDESILDKPVIGRSWRGGGV